MMIRNWNISWSKSRSTCKTKSNTIGISNLVCDILQRCLLNILISLDAGKVRFASDPWNLGISEWWQGYHVWWKTKEHRELTRNKKGILFISDNESSEQWPLPQIHQQPFQLLIHEEKTTCFFTLSVHRAILN